MMIHDDIFKNNYEPSYGHNLYLQCINQNQINQNKLKIGFYYGFSAKCNIPYLSRQLTTYHIIRYDGHHLGNFNIYFLFSLYNHNHQNMYWTHGIEYNNLFPLSNPIFYQLNRNNIYDMILADETISDDRKNELIAELNNNINNQSTVQLREREQQEHAHAHAREQEHVVTCSICMTNPLNRVITTCGHTLCNVCAMHSSYNRCHMCRTPINRNNDIRPLFISYS